MKNNKRHQFGFTLLELIIVIGIISILATFLVATLNPFEQFKKSNDARRKSDLSQLQKSLEQYYSDNGRYPSSDSSFLIVGLDGNSIQFGSSWTPYMDVLPKDPSGSKTYAYYSPSTANGQTYFLYASLDRGGKDPQACNSDGSKCANAQDAICGNVCNFGVSSPNVTP